MLPENFICRPSTSMYIRVWITSSFRNKSRSVKTNVFKNFRNRKEGLMLRMRIQLLVHIWRDTEKNGRQQLCTPYYDSQLPPYEFHRATILARDNANSLGHWTFLQGASERQCSTSFKIYPIWYRAEDCKLPTCGWYLLRTFC